MPYTAEISRTNPSCVLFLIDQSQSMAGPLGRSKGTTKARAVADAVNNLLYALVLRCVRGKEILDRFHVGVLGYGVKVGPAFGGGLAGRAVVPIAELAKNPLRVETRAAKVEKGGQVVEQTTRAPIWFEPKADGKTPMTAALELAWGVLSNFLDDHPTCYPPMVINITDGEASDGDPEGSAGRICSLSSADGKVLLFNLHLSSRSEAPVEFPENADALPDSFAKRLFRMSSRLPAPMHAAAAQEGLSIRRGTRGFVFNADLAAVIRFLNIGTRVDPKNLR
jgi:hypothetical protein